MKQMCDLCVGVCLDLKGVDIKTQFIFVLIELSSDRDHLAQLGTSKAFVPPQLAAEDARSIIQQETGIILACEDLDDRGDDVD